jgi:hypothetical protein
MPIQDKRQNALFKGNCPSKYVTPKMLSYLSERAMALCVCYSLLSFDMQCSSPERFQTFRSARGHAHPHSDKVVLLYVKVILLDLGRSCLI